MSDNTRLLYYLMQFVEENNITGLLLLIDFEKAFDSLSWSFMQEVLTYFNFGPSIIQWISTFYKTRMMFIKHYAPNRCLCIKVAKSTMFN